MKKRSISENSSHVQVPTDPLSHKKCQMRNWATGSDDKTGQHYQQ